MNKIGPMLLIALCMALFNVQAAAAEETFTFGPFGKVSLYRPSAEPGRVVLFVSGDGGWNKGVVDMARALTGLDAAVAGIDITHYFKVLEASDEKCAYPAGDLEELSKFVQKRIGLSRYVAPVLVGYSSGATLVYAALAQAPPSTFAGAISLGFCPDLEINKAVCRGSGLDSRPKAKGKGYDLRPSSTLSSPWVAFQGAIDQVCDMRRTEAFVKQVPLGELVLLPKVGHGFSVERNWMPQFREAFARVAASGNEKAKETAIGDLPLAEMPGTAESDLLAVIISGDGGWAGIDRSIGNYLVEKGVSVVGLNSLQYFWTGRTPEGAGADLDRIIRYYSRAWNKQKVLAIGYSFGADVLPFMMANLTNDSREKIVLAALLSPSDNAEFEFHLTNWVKGPSGKTSHPVLPALEKLRNTRLLCFYGSEEKDNICKKADRSEITPIELKGGHHYDGNYKAIVDSILRSLGPGAR